MFAFRPNGNAKTAIPTTRSARSTCPSSCELKGGGCYAENYPMVMQWDKLTVSGLSYAELLAEIKALKRGTLWRHNDAGDLIGNADTIDLTALISLVAANRGRRGFTYTHWPWRKNADLLAWANRQGFTINVSSADIPDAISAFKEGLPTTVVLRTDKKMVWVDGVKIVICPAQTKGWTCLRCGLCQIPDRDYIVGFLPHGTKARIIPAITV